MTARTGMVGEGMSKVASYRDGDPEAARMTAVKWLRRRCGELGIKCEL